MGVRIFLLILILVSVTASKDKRFADNLRARQILNEIQSDSSEQLQQTHQNNRRSNDDNVDEEYLELRTVKRSKVNDNGPVITLQNRAAMNTRLRVLYVDGNCNPFLAETGTLWVFQTKSIVLPVDAHNIQIMVEKDLFAGNWRTAYSGVLDESNTCMRITGVTLASHTKPCE